jgi:hypothetical protein
MKRTGLWQQIAALPDDIPMILGPAIKPAPMATERPKAEDDWSNATGGDIFPGQHVTVGVDDPRRRFVETIVAGREAAECAVEARDGVWTLPRNGFYPGQRIQLGAMACWAEIVGKGSDGLVSYKWCSSVGGAPPLHGTTCVRPVHELQEMAAMARVALAQRRAMEAAQ